MKTQATDYAPALDAIEQQVLKSDLLPKAYSKYKPVLAESLRFFLARLPASRLRPIFNEQAALPSRTPFSHRLVRFLHHLPALHKLGQVVARDRRLKLEFRRKLQQLESIRSPAPHPDVMRLLRQEFKPGLNSQIQIASKPLAEGSVAVIIPFSWHHPHSSSPVEGVFKALKPGIVPRLSEDLEILGAIGHFLDEECDRLRLPALDYADTFERIRQLLQNEVHVEQEQRTLREAARVYDSMNSVIIPELLPFCTERVTAMRRIHGEKITDNVLLEEPMRKAVAVALGQALVSIPMFSAEPAALFHADPHAGNLMVTKSGELAVLDWSLSGRLGKAERVDIVQLLLGAVSLNAGKMLAVLESLAAAPLNHARARPILEHSLRELRHGVFPGIVWLTNLLDLLAIGAGAKFQSDLLLFRKSLLTLEGVLGDLLPSQTQGRCTLDQTVTTAFLTRWQTELPERFRAPLSTRHFATHVSTADLLWWVWSTPAILSQWWTQTGLELLEQSAATSRTLRQFPASLAESGVWPAWVQPQHLKKPGKVSPKHSTAAV